MSEQIDEDCDECHSQDEDMEDDDPASKMLQGCLMSIVETLSYNNPQ